MCRARNSRAARRAPVTGLLSRNFCTGSLAAHMEAHSYDAAIVFGACDKMLAGNLRALAETDLARQRRTCAAAFRDGDTFTDQQGSLCNGRGAPAVRAFAEPPVRRPSADELDELLHRPLKSEVYAGREVPARPVLSSAPCQRERKGRSRTPHGAMHRGSGRQLRRIGSIHGPSHDACRLRYCAARTGYPRSSLLPINN